MTESIPPFLSAEQKLPDEDALASTRAALYEAGLEDMASHVVSYTTSDGHTHVDSVVSAAAQCTPFLEQLKTFSTTIGPEFAKQALTAQSASPEHVARYKREGNFILPGGNRPS